MFVDPSAEADVRVEEVVGGGARRDVEADHPDPARTRRRVVQVTRSTAVAPPLEPTTVHAPEHDQVDVRARVDALPVVTVYDALAFLVELDHDVVAELDG